MAQASHHVSCITDDPDALDAFLTGIIGLQLLMEFQCSGEGMTLTAGWPPSDGAPVKMYGRPPTGLVEVIAIPESLRGQVAPGISLVSFATPNLLKRIDDARNAGYNFEGPLDIRDGDVNIDFAVVRVGGIVWECVDIKPTGAGG